MDVQLNANVQGQDRAECGKYETGGMISFICWARKHVGNAAAHDLSDDASTTDQKSLMCTCITDFAMTPAINPTRMYQIK